MQLSIVIVNYKTKGLLRQCLRGIYQHPPHIAFEVIVVDNGSRDGSVAMVTEEFPQVRSLALSSNLGYARGSNTGLALAQGAFLLLLNPDIVVEDDNLDRLYRFAMDHPRAGVVGPQLLNPDRTIQHSAFRWYRVLTPLCRRTMLQRTAWGKRELQRFLMLDWDHGTERSVEWFMSSCVLVRREALADVGTFDERFFVYFADTDFCRRMWLKGWQVYYTPRVQFVHYYRRESAEDWWLTGIHIHDWLQYLWKWRRQSPPIAKG